MASAPVVSASASSLPLRIEALAKRFQELTAVDGITLELNDGECLGLLGPNGAGKSTLIRSIVGRVIPDSGKVSVFGAVADSVTARMALGWVPQDLALYPRRPTPPTPADPDRVSSDRSTWLSISAEFLVRGQETDSSHLLDLP